MTDSILNAAHSKTAEEVARTLGVVPKVGLAQGEIAARRLRHGANQLVTREKQNAVIVLLHQFDSVIVWLLAFAAGLSFFMNEIAEGLAIVVVLILNGAIGFATELRAARSMEALRSIAEVKTRIRRGGQERMVDAHEIVPGDVVVLEAGDVVTADLRLAEAANLQSDEFVLTGESTPVVKRSEPVGSAAAIGDRASMAFKGTAITQGSGEGIVTATGMATELGKISDLAQSAESEVSPLERRLDRLGHKLVWLTLALTTVTIGVGILRGNDIAAMVQTGVALAVAAVPEGLPVVATLSLARGMWRMAARNAIISNLSSVETLGSTTVILTDKTGTLTENRMTVVRYLLADGDAAVRLDPDGVRFGVEGKTLDPAKDRRLRAVLRIGALCNNASLGDGLEDGTSGDPMEVALLRLAKTAGQSRADLLEDLHEVKEHAFDPDLKMMATVHSDDDGFIYAVKGAPEAVIGACTGMLGRDGEEPLDDDVRSSWMRRSRDAAGDGLRLLALATKRTDSDNVDPYGGLTLAGLVCLRDPLRADVAEAIAASRAAGVRVVMLTGDHADTATAIARDAGLGNGTVTVIEGHELTDLDLDIDEGLRARILSADVFARVAPATKLKLAALFQRNGEIVAMTGDGVNDAPALKKADIGIAMGLRGTQVAREAAHMVLKDDAFSTIIAAMRQGRVIFDNIRKFVVYLMSCNVSEVLIVGLAVGIGLPTPLLPLQILFLNLVTDVFPAFALGLGSGDERIMRQPPRDPSEQILDRRRFIKIGVLGGAITLATLGAFWLSLDVLGLETAPAITVAFVTLALAQLWNVFNVRVPGSSMFINEVTRNPWVWSAIALCLVLIAAVLWVPSLSDVLRLPHPGRTGLGLALGASLLPLLGGQLYLAFAPAEP